MKSKKYRRERAAPIEDLKNILADAGKSPKWFFENYCLINSFLDDYYSTYKEFLKDLNQDEYLSPVIEAGYKNLKKDFKLS